ncbi:hypothetical protein FGM00_17185 [Aggregatimonas sangjinii]|uniref:Bulb-type lectin domain-containing protein n=1 Tax=Aggregatimonas sangjinii TaxID=2583587 RepID=A0A5B7SSK3_9FLAO|nr:hypothetical protein [Aggregatimonas sangjinii]QCX01765.1 hypothetical protein FGM00_17185 [Aggregatimonas sangjinii]
MGLKKILISIILFSLGACTADDEGVAPVPVSEKVFLGELEWTKNFGGSGEESAQAVIATADGGYAVLGFTNSTDGDLAGKTIPVNDYWLLKLDSDGNLEWSKTYGGSKDDRGQSLVQTADGGYSLTGYAMSSDGDGSVNNGFHDNWVIKLDAQGTLQWEKSFGFSGHDHSYDIIETQDGGLFFSGFLDITSAQADGYTEKGNGSITAHGVGEFWGTKLDAQGNMEWRKFFGGTNNDRSHAVVQSEDGGFVLSGFSESDDFDIKNSRGSYDFWVVKINEEGELIWQNSYGGSGIDIAYDITKTADNGYVVVGHTFSDDQDVNKNHGEADVWMIKIDDEGNLVWERNFGGGAFDAAQGVSLSADGGFIISGNSKSTSMDVSANAGENDMWLIKTDANGKMVWQKTFGGDGLDYGFDAFETDGGGIILVGETSSQNFLDFPNHGKTDVVVLHIK